MAFLSLSGIRKEFGEYVAPQHFELRVEGGDFVSFLGPSGSG